MPTIVGLASASIALGPAMGICALSAYVLVVVAALMLPETRGRDLRTLDEAYASASKPVAAKTTAAQ
jgi:predicted Zn-dependent protease